MICTDREKQLPAYLEGILSPGEMEECRVHLESCETCRKILEDLKKTDRLLRGLAEVEPPPWLQQQIMARVRTEAEEHKGFWRRFFFPLYIKIPVQAFAVIVISILAFYVYRQDEPQMRMKGISLPPAPAFEAKKDQVLPRYPVVPGKAPASREIFGQSDKGMTALSASRGGGVDLPESTGSTAEDVVAGPAVSDQVMPEKVADPVPPVLPEKSVVQRSEAKGFSPVMKQKEAETSLPGMIAGEKNEGCERDMCLAEEKTSRGAVGLSVSQDAAMKDPRPTLELVLTVKDVGSAVAELDKFVENSGPRYTAVAVREGKQVFTTELRTPFVGSFLERLKTLGALGEYVRPEFGKDVQWVKIKVFIITSANDKP
jgi:hypothetical protein